MERLSFAELFQKYIRGKASPAEVRELRDFVQDNEYAAEFDVLLEQAYTDKDLRVSDPEAMEEAWSSFKKEQSAQKTRTGFSRPLLFRVAAILLIILTGGILYFYTTPFVSTPPQSLVKEIPDVKPGGDKAILTLADGTNIVLDSANKGYLTQQGNAQVVSLNNGLLTYTKNTGVQHTNEVLYNTVRTPKGGKYKVLLPDGSTVWLNAESSVRFPIVFTNERKIEITGEVYFEVKASATDPFIVKTKDAVVQVLGTRFNINDYGDKGWVETTLVDGSLRVCGNDGSSKGDMSNSVKLLPGQQARVKVTSPPKGQLSQQVEISTLKADVEKVMSWHRDVFNFEDETLENVMKELARWYDITVVYESTIPSIEFGGELSRNISLAGVLKALEDSRVKFKIQDRKIFILNQ